MILYTQLERFGKNSDFHTHLFVLWMIEMVCEYKSSIKVSRGTQSVSNWSLDSKLSVPLPVSLHCTGNSAPQKIPRLHCKRQQASLFTMFTDWKWHHSSTSLHSQQSHSYCTVNTDVTNEITQGEVWFRWDSNTNCCQCFLPAQDELLSIFILWAVSL